jgi:hypothetical protein
MTPRIAVVLGQDCKRQIQEIRRRGHRDVVFLDGYRNHARFPISVTHIVCTKWCRHVWFYEMTRRFPSGHHVMVGKGLAEILSAIERFKATA